MAFYKKLRFASAILALLISLITTVEAQECLGPQGTPIPCPGNGGGGTTNSGGTTTIFNRTTTGWSVSGWGGGTGGTILGGTTGGTVGGLLGGTSWRAGQNFGGISGPGGGIAVGRNFVASGTGMNGLGNGLGYNDQINAAACTMLGIPMGSFGALVMSFAGIIAIVSGALGAYKMALSTIVVGAGSWILFPIVQLFFPVQCGFF